MPFGAGYNGGGTCFGFFRFLEEPELTLEPDPIIFVSVSPAEDNAGTAGTAGIKVEGLVV